MRASDAGLSRGGLQLHVLGERLDERLGHEHVQPALDGGHRDRKVRVVRREDDHAVAALHRVHGLLARERIERDVVGRKALDREVESLVDLPDLLAHRLARQRQLGAHRVGQQDAPDHAAAPHVEHAQRRHAAALVRGRAAIEDAAAVVLTGRTEKGRDGARACLCEEAPFRGRGERV